MNVINFLIETSFWAPRLYFPGGLGRAIRITRRVAAQFSLALAIAVSGCLPYAAKTDPPILLFNGTGSSANSVAALETILANKHLEYARVNSAQLNAMSETQLRAYQLLIVPGGDYVKMGNSLTARTTANIHDAVTNGLNYLGICAGGLLAGDASGNSLNLSSGIRFDFYASVNRGVHKAAVPISFKETPDVEHYWEDGPQFSGWGDIIGKYPDGTPAIVEASVGRGRVILCGVHPEAPASWRRGMNFTTPASIDHEYAGTLIEAALRGTVLPHF